MLPSLLIRDLHPFGKKEPPQRFTSGHSPEDSRNRDIPHLCSSNEHVRVVIQSICQIPQGSLKNGEKVCPHCELWVLTALSETCNAPSVCHLTTGFSLPHSLSVNGRSTPLAHLLSSGLSFWRDSPKECSSVVLAQKPGQIMLKLIYY